MFGDVCNRVGNFQGVRDLIVQGGKNGVVESDGSLSTKD